MSLRSKDDFFWPQLPPLESTPREYVQRTLHQIVASEDPIHAASIVDSKTADKVVMLDNPPSKKAALRTRPKPLSSRRQKEIGLFEIPEENRR